MQKLKFEHLILVGICAIYLVFAGYQLRALPAEWYGDISIEHHEVVAILGGTWPWRFNLSAGPAYHYIVAAFAYTQGPRYATYKLASLATGLVAVLMVYLLGKELTGKRAGLLSALAAALSFWLVLFARLGSSPQILSPVLSASSVYFLARFQRTRRTLDAGVSMMFAGWGLFTYPSTFVLPLVVLALIGWQLVFSRPHRLEWRALRIAILVIVPFIAWFAYTVLSTPDFGQSGYVGSKVFAPGEPITVQALIFGKNMVRALGMFQFTGDIAFRTNLSGKPVLDPLSGLLMDLGLVMLFLNPRLRQRWGYLIVPIVILLMPSADPGLPAVEIPSASRSLGAAPFVFVLVGIGLETVFSGLLSKDNPILADLKAQLRLHWAAEQAPTTAEKKVVPVTSLPSLAAPLESARERAIAGVVLVLFAVVIGYLNISKYFGPYAWGLPEHNQPWGLQIARYLDSLPTETTVRLAACCWGDWRDPDPESIYFVLQRPQGRKNILSGAYVNACQDLEPGKSYVVIFSPKQTGLIERIRACFPDAQGQMHTDGLGQQSFYSLEMNIPPPETAK